MASSAIFHEGKLLVLRRSQHEEFLSGYWTGIGGKIGEEEGIEEAALREVEEETGLGEVSLRGPLLVQEFTREDQPGTKAVEITYLCTTHTPDQIQLSKEHDAYGWISEEDIGGLSPVTDFQKENLRKLFIQARKLKI